MDGMMDVRSSHSPAFPWQVTDCAALTHPSGSKSCGRPVAIACGDGRNGQLCT